MNDSSSSTPINAENQIQEELKLKEAELELRRQEIKAKIEGDKRNIWFASPLIVGIFSAIFGIIGTGVGAALQGYWSNQLERQKFESTLI